MFYPELQVPVRFEVAMKNKYLFPLLTLLWIGVIWGHSFQPASVSAAESTAALGWLSGLLEWFPLAITEHLLRKSAHFAEYLILGLLTRPALRSLSWNHSANCLLTGVLVPLFDETIQLFRPGRSGQISDVWLDFAGFACGVLLAMIFREILRAKRAK